LHNTILQTIRALASILKFAQQVFETWQQQFLGD
jgi:hypothetical protein